MILILVSRSIPNRRCAIPENLTSVYAIGTTKAASTIADLHSKLFQREDVPGMT